MTKQRWLPRAARSPRFGVRLIGGILALYVLSAARTFLHAQPDFRPNIVFILTDDLGAADLAADGAPLADTPALDRLRAQSLTFSNGYAPAPICSASRAAFLTGRSPARLHFEFVSKPAGSKPPPGTALIQPEFPINLPLDEVTLAEVLEPAGYVTGFFGKWHLTQANDGYLGNGDTFGPRQQGFRVSGEERGSHPYSYPDRRHAPAGDFTPGAYEPDALTDRAIDFMREHRDERFLLYLSHYYVHDPLGTRCEWLLKKYREKAAKLGVLAAESRIGYAAFVEVMDHLVGRVLDELDELGLAENTLVVFTSDNGGAPQYTNNGAWRGSKWTLYEGGIRVPFIVRWPGVTTAGAVCAAPVIGTDLFPTFADIAGAPLPADRLLDGKSLRSLLEDPRASLARDSLVWHFPFYHLPNVNQTPVSAIRRGDLKLVHHYENNRSELFDLAVDPGETRDLSRVRPADAQRLEVELLAQLRTMDARLPRPAPGH